MKEVKPLPTYQLDADVLARRKIGSWESESRKRKGGSYAHVRRNVSFLVLLPILSGASIRSRPFHERGMTSTRRARESGSVSRTSLCPVRFSSGADPKARERVLRRSPAFPSAHRCKSLRKIPFRSSFPSDTSRPRASPSRASRPRRGSRPSLPPLFFLVGKGWRDSGMEGIRSLPLGAKGTETDRTRGSPGLTPGSVGPSNPKGGGGASADRIETEIHAVHPVL